MVLDLRLPLGVPIVHGHFPVRDRFFCLYLVLCLGQLPRPRDQVLLPCLPLPFGLLGLRLLVGGYCPDDPFGDCLLLEASLSLRSF